MNNHSDIWKNITMIIFLVIFIILIIFVFSKIKLEIYFSFSNFDYMYSIGLIYFVKIKTLYKSDIEKYVIHQKRKKKINNSKKKKSKLQINEMKTILKYVDFEKLIVEFNSGFISLLPTVFSIPVISTILSSIYTILNIKYDENHVFCVKPVYDKLNISGKIHCIVSMKIAHIIYVLLILAFERRKKNGKSSNRGVNEYCYE